MLVQELRDLLLRILPDTSFRTYPPFRAGCFHSTTHFNLTEWKGPSDITQHFCAKLLPFLSQFHTVKTLCSKNDLPSPRCLLNQSEYCNAKVIFNHSRAATVDFHPLICLPLTLRLLGQTPAPPVIQFNRAESGYNSLKDNILTSLWISGFPETFIQAFLITGSYQFSSGFGAFVCLHSGAVE